MTDAAVRPQRLRRAVHVAFALGLLNVLALNVGGLGATNSRFAGFLVWVTWLVLLHRDLDARRLRGLPGLAAATAIAFHFRCESRLALTVSACVLIAVTRLVMRSDARAALRACAAGAASYAVVSFAYLAAPATLVPLQRASVAWSARLGEVWLDLPLALGPTLAGGWVLLSLVCVLVARFAILERRPRALAVGIACVLVVHFAWALGVHALPESLRTRETMTSAPAALLLVAAVPVAWITAASARSVSRSRAGGRGAVVSVAAALVAAALLGIALQAPLVRGRDAPRVLFYGVNEGPILNWDKPDFDAFGPYAYGMFGLLLDTLRADGFEIEVLDERIRREHLDGCDALVTINVDTEWTVEELRAVWDYVDEGGALLVLGDHTDVEGTRASQNALIAPTGIELEFDSALPSPLQGWSGADLFAHGIHAGVTRPGELGIGVGASLSLDDPEALPVVSARYGLADVGDRTAAERAFLGDYEYQLGERFGDVVVVAWRRSGDGRYLVFGDTSSFQNPALVSGSPFVRRTFAWLTGDVVFDTGPWNGVLVSLVVVAAWFGLARRGGGRGLADVLVPIALLGAWTGSAWWQASWLERPRLDAPIAHLDLAHGPRIDAAREGKNAIGGLVQNLHRNGYLVAPVLDFDDVELRRGDVLVSIAPVEPYTPSEIARLHAFMERGGLVILAVGYFQKGPAETLLDAVGLDVSDAPVGPIPLWRPEGRERLGVEYVEAWPVIVEAAAAAAGSPSPEAGAAPEVEADVEVLGRFRDVPLAVRRPVGDGALLLVADTYFFSSRNLEDLDAVSLPNVYFLKQVLDDHRRRVGDS